MMNIILSKLVCRLIGHDWHNLTPQLRTDAYPFVECYRCKTTGWLG